MLLNSGGIQSSLLLTLSKILALGISYASVGYICLQLAISSDYISPIFLPAGIAIAALIIWGVHLWPGIFLGSLVLSILLFIENGAVSANSIITAFLIAIGATLQALCGNWLIQRYLNSQITLASERDIFQFMLLAGPISCTIGASLASIGLYQAGIIVSQDFFFSWFNSWIGNIVGIAISAPLVFIIYARPRSLWNSRKIVVAIPLVLMLITVITLSLWIKRIEQAQIQFDFKEISVHSLEKLRSSFSSYLDSVSSIERFYSASENVSRDEFRKFVSKNLEVKKGINGLSWNPIIKQAALPVFEKSIQAEGFKNFKVRERDTSGELINVSNRDEYIVVNFIEPFNNNKKAMGFDVSSNPIRRKALNQARDTGLPVATGRITLVQEQGEQSGILLFHPIYSQISESLNSRQKNIKGFAVGVFRVGDIVDAVVANQYRNNLIVKIFDQAAGENQQLYGPTDNMDSTFSYQESFEIGGRTWLIKTFPSQSYLISHDTFQAWFVLILGLLFSSVLGAFLLAMSGNSYLLENKVKARTKDLKENENKLLQINQTLASSNAELERTNIELDQYAFVASHDLKSPLQAINKLASWVEEDCGDSIPEESRRHLSTLKDRANRMEKLLSDLLMFSRISREEYKLEEVNLKDLSENIYSLNAIPEAFRLETVACNTSIIIPRIPLEISLRNLVNNVVKHHDKNSGFIRITYENRENKHIISVIDDGPGIPIDLQEKSLQMFQTLKSRDDLEGSGLGLSIVKKSVERFTGLVKIISNGTRGTTVELHWPKVEINGSHH